ncbi:MAG: selenocysteine-specific elongation factor, partial [Parasphingorhabdus sp.]
MIIATAGHVDHGKTELVKALTGIDTDRLPEEKARGLSIDLGFAYQPLSDNRTLGFVDVPGHEKFIRNMLAGVGGIDLGLLVVAADDGVMPQTREHFAILDLLGINQCVVAITKIDRVDDERILQVQVQVEALLSDAGHKQVAVFPVCAPDNQGVDALKGDLDKRAHGLSIRPHDGHFRMAIDRVFTLKGVGLVVTGMVIAGAATIDDSLVLSYDGSQVRMRGIRAHNEVSDHAQAGQRCAINIVGRGVSESLINRGHWLMHSNLYAPTRRIDVDLRVLDTESRPLKHWTPTHLHIGADHLSARVAVLSGGTIAEGDRGLVQLVLAQDAFVVHGDRFVLRDQSAQRTIAGGHVIDPFSPKRGRARPSRIEALHAMNKHDSRDVLDALTKISEIGVPLNQFSIAHNLPR